MPAKKIITTATTAAAAPVAAPVPVLIPTAAPIAVPEPAPVGPSAVEIMEQQFKNIKDQLASMEKAFKEAKKSMKKPKRDPNAPPKEKKPIPEGTQAWNSFVDLVREEMSVAARTTDPTLPADHKVTRKEAMTKAKELKDAGDARYQYVPKVKPAATSASDTEASASASASDSAAPKKRGRKPAAPTPA
jgi:hypothetical protein